MSKPKPFRPGTATARMLGDSTYYDDEFIGLISTQLAIRPRRGERIDG